MEDIIINGISVNTLKAQKAAIRQGATQVVSDSIEKGKAVVEKLLVAESKEEADTLAAEALSLFETAEVVSGVSGVTFLLPYCEEYGQYDYEDVLSNRISQEDLEEEYQNPNLDFKYSDGSVLYKLYTLLVNMESDSLGWNSSRC